VESNPPSTLSWYKQSGLIQGEYNTEICKSLTKCYTLCNQSELSIKNQQLFP
jgi:hypothetical protein